MEQEPEASSLPRSGDRFIGPARTVRQVIFASRKRGEPTERPSLPPRETRRLVRRSGGASGSIGLESAACRCDSGKGWRANDYCTLALASR